MNRRFFLTSSIVVPLFAVVFAYAQEPTSRPEGRRGPFGSGGPMGQREEKLVKEFDKDGNGRLDRAERDAARKGLADRRAGREGRGPGPGGRGPRGMRGGEDAPTPSEGKAVAKEGAPSFPDAGLYDPAVFRTMFLDFADDDWEKELGDFIRTDVEIPAELTVDGKVYHDVGVHFRGMSSLMMVPAGSKRSLNLSLDFVDEKQRLSGAKTLNLLNAHEDASFLHTVLFSHIARAFIPAPAANLVHLVINGRSWGVYVNVEQFDKRFATTHFGKGDVRRWKVSGSPNGAGGLDYVGDRVDDYRARYEIKSKDEPKAWADLMNLCRVLTETPPDQLERKLEPILDIDGVLRFLALEIVLLNGDGYWIRASDYSLVEDAKGRFHVVPHDMNEVFQPAMTGFGGRRGGDRRGADGPPPGDGPDGFGPPPDGPRRDGGPEGRGPRGGSIDIDPLVGLDDARKPLRSRLLSVPSLQRRYLAYVKAIAQEWLDWQKLGGVVRNYRDLAGQAIEADTRKLSTNEAFRSAVAESTEVEGNEQGPRGRRMSLRQFAEARRKFLLEHPAIKSLEAVK